MPNEVYMALLTGGEPAIINYCSGNNLIGDIRDRISGATMCIAPISEREKTIDKRDGTFIIESNGDVIVTWKNSTCPSEVRNKRKFPNEIVA